MVGLVAGLLLLLAAAGLGQHTLRDNERHHSEALFHAVASGLLLWGVLALIVTAVVGFSRPVFWIITGISLCGWIRPRVRIDAIWLPWLALAVLFLSPGIWDVIGPITGTDERYLHIGLPLQMFNEGQLLGGALHPNGSRPLTLQMLYATALASPWPSAAAGTHWWLAVACLMLVMRMGHQVFEDRRIGILAAATLALSTSFQQESGMAGSDIPTALAVLLALQASLRGHCRAAVVAAGLALSFKYTAAAPLIGIWVLLPVSVLRRFSYGIVAIITVMPWWLRNIAEGVHPLFPFTGWPDPTLSFQFVEKYGMGRSFTDFIALPWRMLFDANPASFEFLGRIHPYCLILLLLFPFVVNQRRFRPWLAASAFGLIGWAVGPHWLRYLIPSLPILALTGAAITLPFTKYKAVKLAVIAGLLLGAISGLKGYQWSGNQPSKGSPGDQAIAFCNQTLDSEDRVALLFAWRNADLKTKKLLGSVEDHVPTRHFLIANKGREIEALVDAGATHALVRNTRFIPKTYGFLNANDFTREFRQPVDRLNHVLLMRADLLFRSNTHSVYRLPNPN